MIPNDTKTSVPMTQVGLAPSVQRNEDINPSLISSTRLDTLVESDIDPSAANFDFAAGFALGTKTN